VCIDSCPSTLNRALHAGCGGLNMVSRQRGLDAAGSGAKANGSPGGATPMAAPNTKLMKLQDLKTIGAI
jgi:hypothetical protein